MNTPVGLDCIGGFVVTQLYGLDRPTADVDLIELAPRNAASVLLNLGGKGSPLHKKFLVYLDLVAVAVYPDSYEERLTEMFPGCFKYLHLLALDPYDLALSKLERNSQKDRDDVRFLARSIPFDLDLLRDRYTTEMRWQLGVPTREDATLELWMKAIKEDRGSASGQGEK